MSENVSSKNDLVIVFRLFHQGREFAAQCVLNESDLTVEKLDNLTSNIACSIRITCLKNKIVPYPDWALETNLGQDEQILSISSDFEKSKGIGTPD